MTSFLSALRESFPSSGALNREKKKNATDATVSSSKKHPATASNTDIGDVPLVLQQLEREYGFQDPFLACSELWAISQPTKERDLLRVLCVDHADLQEANEREAAVGAVGAVVTKKTPKKRAEKSNTSQLSSANQLLQVCSQFTTAASTNSFFSTIELAEMVLQTVQDSPTNPDLVQTQLFGLVGVEGMDIIAFALQNQQELVKCVSKASLHEAHKQQEMALKYGPGGVASARPAVAGAFSIQTESEQLYQKQQRKANRKARAHGDGANDEADELNWLESAGYDPEVLRLQREFAQEEMRNQSTSLLQREFGILKGGYDTTGAAGQLAAAGALTLPANTKRKHYKGYEHVFIPAHAKRTLENGETLVPISELEDFAQTAFHGITHLNRLQSKLFRAAYHSNQNLLVCAPTGAGKTNVAMLTILQEVKSHIQRNLSLSHMKIIYVAPMKALAQEVVTKFSERLQKLKLCVAELTGDMQMTKKEIEETHVIVTTPEKWDVITRKSSAQQALLSKVRLLIIDEVHLLADERGPVIETIVARTLRRVESTQSMIRIVGLSATLPNFVDVASFLRVYVPTGDARMQNAATNGGKGGLFFFDSSYRPVPLDQTFIGVSTNTNLKEALGLSAVALSTTVATEDDSAKAAMEKRMVSSTMSRQRQIQLMMNKLTLAHCLKQVKNNEQVMVFVHSRKETAATMRAIIELAHADEEEPDTLEAFLPSPDLKMPLSLIERIQKSRNRELKELLAYGMGIHHAGMLRSDRNLSEQLFEQGFIRVLCCTATLAWGVNLPAHSVLIKGTQVYNADKGGMTQLSMLDVMQIFGRAGRPQYDTSGDAVLMTTQDQLPHYLRLLTTGIPMESALIKALPDHLNAEIVSGTVSNLDEACEWLSYTYLYVRMRKNPLAYGMKIDDVQQDPQLIERRRQLLMDAAEKLASCRMIKILREKTRLDQAQEGKIAFAVTSMGRVASHFYIQHKSIETFNELLDNKASGDQKSGQDDDDLAWEKVLLVLCSSCEFEQIKSREEEMTELEKLSRNFCRFPVLGGGLESYMGKTNVLLQSLIGKARVSSFTLISDTNYVAQNASRVCRALFEICLKKNSARRAEKFLMMAKSIDQKLWWDQIPLLQLPNIPLDVIGQVEQQKLDLYDALAYPTKYNLSGKVKKWVSSLPYIDIDQVQMQPFSSNMLRLSYSLYPLFSEWKENAFSGRTLSSWIWVEDAVTGYIYHSEYFVLHQTRFMGWKEGTQTLEMECYLPIFISSQQQQANYVIRILSDRFVGIESFYEISYTPNDVDMVKAKKEKDEMYTKLLRLHPQPLLSLENPVYQAIYAQTFQVFNPIQTQTFHQLYHQDGNVLICAPTGSGKTVCAELAMFRVWNKIAGTASLGLEQTTATDDYAQDINLVGERSLIVYIAPLKALAREKVSEWKSRFEQNPRLRKKVVEVTGDTLVSINYIMTKADIVVTTPEKWDLLTRNLSFGRKLMDKIALVIIDEVHLVGDAPRGAVLEVLVSRLRRFSRESQNTSGQQSSIRLLGLSTALANPSDVGRWLGIIRENNGQVYNFRAAVRPVPMEVHLQGFPERHYVSRMAAMNKPTFMAIKTHSPDKPILIFVSSKAQTKLTALDLISFCVSHTDSDSSGSAKRFLKMDEAIMEAICNDGNSISDDTLKHTLTFGIGLHHAGLARKDREMVEKLFRDRMIQVVISTSTLAWGVNLPAHLVIIKGTEYFQNGRYRSYPLSDLLQMIGRAGRPLLDDKGVACVLVEESKKNMIQRFLYEPLAIESCLKDYLANHLNAEIASGLIQTRKDVMEYLSWSLLFQRVLKNPSYYGVDANQSKKLSKTDVEGFFQSLVTKTLEQLEMNQCVTVNSTYSSIQTTFAGKIAAALYVDVRTVSNMLKALRTIISGSNADDARKPSKAMMLLMSVICESSVEIQDTIPLRHNEIQSQLVSELCNKVKFSPMTNLYTQSPKKQKALLETHGSELKAFLLLQMHLSRMRMPSSDFANDLRTLLDQIPRLLSVVIDLCAVLKHTDLVMAGIQLSQAIVQARWPLFFSEEDREVEDVLTQLPFASAHFVRILHTDLQVNGFAELQTALQVKNKKTQIIESLTKSHRGTSNTLSKRQVNEFVYVAETIPRLEVSVAFEKGRQVVQVDIGALNEQLNRLAYAKRFPKPKPYGFYVLFTAKRKSSTELIHMKHIAWQRKVQVMFPVTADDSREESEYEVHVLSDSVLGIDASFPVK